MIKQLFHPYFYVFLGIFIEKPPYRENPKRFYGIPPVTL